MTGIARTGGSRRFKAGDDEGTKIVEDQTGEYFLLDENPLNTMEKTHSDVVFKKTERRFDSPAEMIKVL